MSFYIVLPSNSSIRDFKDNTLTNYTTKLAKKLILKGEYEVGISKFCYPQNWKYKRNGTITFKASSKSETFHVTFSNFAIVGDVVEALNKFLISKSIKILFSFNKTDESINLTIQQQIVIDFSDNINKELGIKFETIMIKDNKDLPFIANYKIKNNIIKSISSLFIYCDCIEHQIVGDGLSALLGTVAVNEIPENFGKNIERDFQPVNYVTLIRNSIDNIQIQILDDTGESIHFEPGKVLVKLHFRPIIRKNLWF